MHIRMDFTGCSSPLTEPSFDISADDDIASLYKGGQSSEEIDTDFALLIELIDKVAANQTDISALKHHIVAVNQKYSTAIP